MKNLQLLQLWSFGTVVLLLTFLSSCDTGGNQEKLDCLGDPSSCSFTDRIIPDTLLQDWVNRFDSIYGGTPGHRYECSRDSLKNFVNGYDAFRIYFGLTEENDLSTMTLISTRIRGNSCSDSPESDPDVFHWAEEEEAPSDSALTAHWRSTAEVSRCDSIGIAPGELFMSIPLAFTFNADSAAKDFLDSTKYEFVYAYLGVEKKFDGDEAPTFHLRLILQGEDTLSNTGSLYLDRAAPCPYICGKKNKLQGSK